jgi:segregation and condensation protein A
LPKIEVSEPGELAMRLQFAAAAARRDAEAGARLSRGPDRPRRFRAARPKAARGQEVAWHLDCTTDSSAYGAIRRAQRPLSCRWPSPGDDAGSALCGSADARRADWAECAPFFPYARRGYCRTALPSSFVATLELARQGKLELDQATLRALYVRAA